MAARLPNALGPLPPAFKQRKATDGAGFFLELTSRSACGSSGPLRPPKLKRFLALARSQKPYWQGPHWGREAAEVPPETQFLLWERTDRRFGILLPLVDGDTRATLSGSTDGLKLDFDGALQPLGAKAPHRCLLYAATGRDPYALIDMAMRSVQREMGTFRLREDKVAPEMLETLGWGTWDAYKQSINARKLEAAVRSFHEAGIRLGFVLLDDGWQDVTGDYLNDFAIHRTKFPKGLRHTIERLKTDYGVQHFAIWLAFEGYWAGLNPEGPLAKRFRTVRNEAVIRPWLSPPPKQALHLVDPHEAHRFYAEYLRFLCAEGVDFVKVDGQSALELFTEGKLGRVSTMRDFQEGLQGAAAVHVASNLLHCMCNGSDIVYHLKSSSLWRNSQDYFPGHPVRVQQRHLVQNAYNNVWMRTVAWPDWDFFQSCQPEAGFHAASRALSGGPVYFDDKAGEADAAMLNGLTTSDGRLLRATQPAWITRDRLFNDPRRERTLMKVANLNTVTGVVGLFHCCGEDVKLKASVRRSDLPELSAKAMVAYAHSSQEVTKLEARERLEIELGPMGWELVTLAPLVGGVAPFGLLDKFNGGAAVLSWDQVGTGQWRGTFSDGGRLGFFCEAAISSLLVNGRRVRLPKVQPNGLVVASVPEGAPVEIALDVTGN